MVLAGGGPGRQNGDMGTAMAWAALVIAVLMVSTWVVSLVVRNATTQALGEVRRVKSLLKKPTKAVIASAMLPASFEALRPAARDFCAATHIRQLAFGSVTEAELQFQDEPLA